MSDLSIANIDTSNMNPGENGAPDQITVRVNIKSSIHGWPSLSQGVGVTVLLEPGTIKKDFDGARSDARKEASRILGALAQSLKT